MGRGSVYQGVWEELSVRCVRDVTCRHAPSVRFADSSLPEGAEAAARRGGACGAEDKRADDIRPYGREERRAQDGEMRLETPRMGMG